MKPRPAYYSLIQYMPDAGRMETINVGVILYEEPNVCLVAVTDDYERVTCCFRGTKRVAVKGAVTAVVERIHTELPCWNGVYNLSYFAARLANDIRVSDPRPMVLRQSRATELQTLFDELVSDRKPNDA